MSGSVVAALTGDRTHIELDVGEWVSFIHPDDLPNLSEMMNDTLSGKRTRSDAEYRLKHPDGNWYWYRVTGGVVEHDSQGKPCVGSGVVWNIDAARRAELDLAERQQRFERIYRASPAMMHTIDADGYIVEVSDYWLAQLGYERQEVIGRKSVEFLDPESREQALVESLPYLFEHGYNSDIAYRFVRKNGTIMHGLLSSFLERDEAGKPLRSYAVVTNVTALFKANEDLARTNRELDRFATVASHDLQEPLRKIAAFSSLVQRRYADQLDEDGVRHLDFLVDAAHRMQRLIDDLLAYSRLASQSIEPRPVDVRRAVNDVLENLDASITESGARLIIGDLPMVQADPTLLDQILQNLISNAIKYRADAVPEVSIDAHPHEKGWVISVTDNGIGLDVKFAEKDFRALPAPALPGSLQGHRDRSGHRPPGRGTPQRADLGGKRGRQGCEILGALPRQGPPVHPGRHRCGPGGEIAIRSAARRSDRAGTPGAPDKARKRHRPGPTLRSRCRQSSDQWRCPADRPGHRSACRQPP